MKASSLRDIVAGFAAAGLEVFERMTGRRHDSLVSMCKRLLRLKGEASTLVLAHDILATYNRLSRPDRLSFFKRLLAEFMPDPEGLKQAISRYQREPTPSTVAALGAAAESP